MLETSAWCYSRRPRQAPELQGSQTCALRGGEAEVTAGAARRSSARDPAGALAPHPAIASCCLRGLPSAPPTPTPQPGRVPALPASCPRPPPGDGDVPWLAAGCSAGERRGMLCRQSRPGAATVRQTGVSAPPRLVLPPAWAALIPGLSPASCRRRHGRPGHGFRFSVCREKGAGSVCLGSPGSLGTGLGAPGAGGPGGRWQQGPVGSRAGRVGGQGPAGGCWCLSG